MEQGYIVTAELLKDSYFNKVESLKEKTLLEVFIEHNEDQAKNVGNGVAKATHWISVYTFRLVKEYMLQKYERNDIYLRELNQNFIQSFHTFLKIDKGMKQNSATKIVIMSQVGLQKEKNEIILNNLLKDMNFFFLKSNKTFVIYINVCNFVG